jgi:hypothetical protein
MAQYRFLTDHMLPGGGYVQAGTTLSTVDVGGTLPTNWVPSNAVDPLDSPAVNAFYARGPQITPLIRGQWSDVFVAAPKTYWKQIPATNQWQLTGLGSALPPIGI